MVFFVVNFPVTAETSGGGNPLSPYHFSSALSAGLVYGQAAEMVYKYPNNEVPMSQLLWDIRPVFYAASSLEFSRTKPQGRIGFFSQIVLKAGFPSKSGIMEDRDWIDSNELTHFSSHNNYTQEALFLDLSAGLSFSLPLRFLVKIYGTFFYMSYSWVARDGYFKYDAEEAGFGAVLIYSQKWLILTPGISLYSPFFSFLGLALSLQLSPAVFCIAEDDHLLRQIQFMDYIAGGLYFEPRGELIFFPGKKISFSLHVSYRFLKGRGKTYSRSVDNVEFVKTGNYDASGAGYAALDAGLSFRVNF
ncbi:MAG: omptin family outer membrane protease [Treponema sp.]|nr:omptin family outer membrane protease [Treponema sp.]